MSLVYALGHTLSSPFCILGYTFQYGILLSIQTILETVPMVKKIQALADWLSAHDSAHLLSLKHDRPISSKYIRTLSKRKKQPVRTQEMSNRLLYNRDDLEKVVIKKKRDTTN